MKIFTKTLLKRYYFAIIQRVKIKQKQLKFLLLVYLISQVAFYSFAPLYALFASGLGLNLQWISFIWSGYSLLTAAFILIMGRLENKRNKGYMMTLGFALAAVSSVFLLLVHSRESLMVALAINALASGVIFPAYKTMFAKSQTQGKESEQWAWLDAGNMLSSAVGASIGGIIVAVFGFPGLFVTMAALQLAAAAVVYLYFTPRTVATSFLAALRLQWRE